MTDKKSKSGTIIKSCTCKNAFQDDRYGKGLRVHNVSGDGTKCKCTVCSKERSA